MTGESVSSAVSSVSTSEASRSEETRSSLYINQSRGRTGRSLEKCSQSSRHCSQSLGRTSRRRQSGPFRLHPKLVTIDTMDKTQNCCVVM